MAMEVRLPQEKLRKLKTVLGTWRGRKACRKRDILSLIGSLTHACRAVRPGRCYGRRLIDLSTTAKKLDQFVRLNREARADIEWWFSFVSSWNGTAMMLADLVSNPSITLTSDASGNWGCGAYVGSHWFMLPWMGRVQGAHITVKELVPIVIAAVMWGKEWKGEAVLARCDNAAVVAIVNSGTSRNPQAMHLRRCLAFLAARMDFNIRAAHIRDTFPFLLSSGRPTGNSSITRSLGRSATPGPRLDGEGLDRAVAFYLGQALADSTKKSYKSATRRYHSFCTVHNINPLPVCEQSLSRYAASLANEGLAHTSIKCYMSAVRHLHIEEGWGDPKLNCMPKLELVMRGIKRVQGRKQNPVHVSLLPQSY